LRWLLALTMSEWNNIKFIVVLGSENISKHYKINCRFH